MKKVLLVILLLIMTGCNYRDYTQLSYVDLNTKLENEDSFVLVLGSSTCSACAAYKNTMREVMQDKKVEIFYLDLKSLTEEENSKVYSKFVVQATPTTVFIVNGKEVSYDRLTGTASYGDVVAKLKKYGYVGE